MPTLKAFDCVHQRPAVGLSVARKSGVRGDVANEPQEIGETRHTHVWLTWLDGLGDNRKFLPVVAACQFDVVREGLFGPAVAGKWRLHFVQDRLQVRSGQDSVM